MFQIYIILILSLSSKFSAQGWSNYSFRSYSNDFFRNSFTHRFFLKIFRWFLQEFVQIFNPELLHRFLREFLQGFHWRLFSTEYFSRHLSSISFKGTYYWILFPADSENFPVIFSRNFYSNAVWKFSRD